MAISRRKLIRLRWALMRALVERGRGVVLDHMCLIHCHSTGCYKQYLVNSEMRENKFSRVWENVGSDDDDRDVIEHHLRIIVTIVMLDAVQYITVTSFCVRTHVDVCMRVEKRSLALRQTRQREKDARWVSLCAHTHWGAYLRCEREQEGEEDCWTNLPSMIPPSLDWH